MINQLVRRIQKYQPRTLSFDFPEAGILVPVTQCNRQPELILTRRTQEMSTHAGQVAFPGGKKDIEDETLLATALREAEEEIGLTPSDVTVVGL